MPLWSKGIKRSQTGEFRIEDDIRSILKDFFSEQKGVNSYELVDEKNPTVNIDGSLSLNQEDLSDGELFFKIGKLDGNLYFYGKYMKPSVIPDEMSGDIIIVQDEGQSTKSNEGDMSGEEPFGMALRTTTAPSKYKLQKQFEDLISQCLYAGITFDFEEIKNKVAKDWQNRNKYNLHIKSEKHKGSGRIKIDFYLTDDENEKPLKLSAIEKALYILFILREEGIDLTDIKSGDIKLWQDIYKKLSDSALDLDNGLLSEDYIFKYKPTTLNGYRSNIRAAINDKIPYSRIVDEFAIEGFKKNDPFKVERATPQLRDELKTLFDIQ